jgi:hypothetical protein
VNKTVSKRRRLKKRLSVWLKLPDLRLNRKKPSKKKPKDCKKKRNSRKSKSELRLKRRGLSRKRQLRP